jgi:long-chain acyl-CoA synthetase
MDGTTRASSGPAMAEPGSAAARHEYASNPAAVADGTLIDLLFQAVDEFDKTDALMERGPAGWSSFSHREIIEQIRFTAEALVVDGTVRGDRVAILSENRPEWAVADYALLCTGALNVPIYPSLPADQIAFMFDHAEIETAFVSTAEQLTKLLEVRANWARLRRIIVFDDIPTPADGVTTLRAFMERGREAGNPENEFRRRAKLAMPEDVATLVYTSGTTGTPKGVMLTHNNLYTNVTAALQGFPLGPADIALSFLPLSHVFQRIVDYVMFSYGVTIAYVASIDDVSRSFREVHPTIAVSVPRVYEKVYARILSEKGLKHRIILWARTVASDWTQTMLAGRRPGLLLRLRQRVADRLVYAKVRESMGGRIHFFISGGAPLATQIAEFFWGAGLPILEGYGLTETSPVTNLNTPTHTRIGTVGRPIAGTEIRVAGDGEILVRGPQVMKGYYRDSESTAKVIDGDGWFSTGDIGIIDADGYLRITDRKKQLLKTAGGKYIAPQPIENEIKRSRFVSEAVVIGDRRPYPIVLVVPNFGTLTEWAKQHGTATASTESLVAEPAVVAKIEEEVNRRIGGFARFEQPKKVLLLARELSLENDEITPTLKVKRRVVEKRYADRIEELYAEPSPPGQH